MYAKLLIILACFATSKAAVIPDSKLARVPGVQPTDLSPTTESNAINGSDSQCAGFLHYYEGPKFIIANRTGVVRACAVAHPGCCYTLAKVDQQVNSIVLAEKYIYLGLYHSKKIMRCELEKIDSCQNWTSTDGSVNALAVVDEHIYAGLGTGIMLRCQLNDSRSCTHFNNAGRHNSEPIAINAIAFGERHSSVSGMQRSIYAALKNDSMWRCGVDRNNNCQLFNQLKELTSLATSEDGKYIFSGLSSGELYNCLTKNDNACYRYNMQNLNNKIVSLNSFGDHVYAGLENGTMTRCLISDIKNCENVYNYGFEFSFITVKRAVITDSNLH